MFCSGVSVTFALFVRTVILHKLKKCEEKKCFHFSTGRLDLD